MEIIIFDLTMGVESTGDGTTGLAEVQFEVNNARAVREAVGQVALGDAAGPEVGRSAAYDVSAANAAGASAQS
jgi:hypothetical protein